MSTLLDEMRRHLGSADSDLRWALDRAAKRGVKYPEATHDVIAARATKAALMEVLGTILHAQQKGAGITGDVNWTYCATRLAQDYLFARECEKRQQAVAAVLADPTFAVAVAEVEAEAAA